MPAHSPSRISITRIVAEVFRAAVEQHRAGRLREAAGLYAEVYALDPYHADALFLLAVIARQKNCLPQATALLGRAIALRPGQRRFLWELAQVRRLSSRVAGRRRCEPSLGAHRTGRAARAVTIEATHRAMTTTHDPIQLEPIQQAARTAGMSVLDTKQGTASDGQPTTTVLLGLSAETTADRVLALELSNAFIPERADLQPGLTAYLLEQARRLRNPRPDCYVTLAGLPLAFTGFQWPFHRSTSGADTLIVHGTVRLEDGSGSPLHAKISASMTVTFAEIVPAPEQPYAESFIYNAIRKTLDQGQLEMLKSGNRQPVPVTTRYYSRWQNKFIFADTTEQARADFLALKVYWLSGVLGGNQPVWIADPRDAQYLNTTPDDLKAMAQQQAHAGMLTLADDFATPTEALHERGQHFRTQLTEALALTKPEFNEEMRAGHTNM